MTFHIFICILCLLWLFYELTMWLTPRWFDSSVVRALHQYHRGHGFKFCLGLKSFLALILQLLKLCVQLQPSIISSFLSLQFKYTIFHIIHLHTHNSCANVSFNFFEKKKCILLLLDLLGSGCFNCISFTAKLKGSFVSNSFIVLGRITGSLTAVIVYGWFFTQIHGHNFLSVKSW